MRLTSRFITEVYNAFWYIHCHYTLNSPARACHPDTATAALSACPRRRQRSTAGVGEVPSGEVRQIMLLRSIYKMGNMRGIGLTNSTS